MKRYLLFSLLSISTIFTYGQKIEVFRDDFNNNINRWEEGKETKVERYFRSGQYYIINDDTKSTFTGSTSIIKIDPDENFSIETSVALNRQNTEGVYLIYGADKGNIYFIRIHKWIIPRGHTYNYGPPEYNEVFIGKYMDGSMIGQTIDKNVVNGFGQYNTIVIKKKGNSINFYVNKSKVFSKAFEPFFGNEIGFGCDGTQSVSIDYLSIKQDKQNFNEVYETRREHFNNNIDFTTVKLEKKGTVYEIPVELNGVLKINFVFDTGASDVSISPDVALTLIRTGTIEDDDWLEGQYYRFADGSSAKSMRFKLKSVNVGGKIIKDVTCSISNNIEAPMLLGQSVLSKFGKYTFDYSSNKLIIE